MKKKIFGRFAFVVVAYKIAIEVNNLRKKNYCEHGFCVSSFTSPEAEICCCCPPSSDSKKRREENRVAEKLNSVFTTTKFTIDHQTTNWTFHIFPFNKDELTSTFSLSLSPAHDRSAASSSAIFKQLFAGVKRCQPKKKLFLVAKSKQISTFRMCENEVKWDNFSWWIVRSDGWT